MQQDKNNEKLQSRREFFKKTTKGMLPMLGAFIVAPSIIMSSLTSCGCDDWRPPVWTTAKTHARKLVLRDVRKVARMGVLRHV